MSLAAHQDKVITFLEAALVFSMMIAGIASTVAIMVIRMLARERGEFKPFRRIT